MALDILLWRKSVESVFVHSNDIVPDTKVIHVTCLVLCNSPELLIQAGVKRSVEMQRFAYMLGQFRHKESEQKGYMTALNLVVCILVTRNEDYFYAMFKIAVYNSRG